MQSAVDYQIPFIQFRLIIEGITNEYTPIQSCLLDAVLVIFKQDNAFIRTVQLNIAFVNEGKVVKSRNRKIENIY